jgi:hypothetical protein
MTMLLTCSDFAAHSGTPLSSPAPRRCSKPRGRIPLPPFPTAALPGTAQKVAIMAERARQRVALWHPGDAAFDREGVICKRLAEPA